MSSLYTKTNMIRENFSHSVGKYRCKSFFSRMEEKKNCKLKNKKKQKRKFLNVR